MAVLSSKKSRVPLFVGILLAAALLLCLGLGLIVVAVGSSSDDPSVDQLTEQIRREHGDVLYQPLVDLNTAMKAAVEFGCPDSFQTKEEDLRPAYDRPGRTERQAAESLGYPPITLFKVSCVASAGNSIEFEADKATGQVYSATVTGGEWTVSAPPVAASFDKIFSRLLTAQMLSELRSQAEGYASEVPILPASPPRSDWQPIQTFRSNGCKLLIGPNSKNTYFMTVLCRNN